VISADLYLLALVAFCALLALAIVWFKSANNEREIRDLRSMLVNGRGNKK